jgi:hypothetical protein
LVAASVTSCGNGGADAPTELMDGSPVRGVPVQLEGIDSPVVLTRVRVKPAGEVASSPAGAACIGRADETSVAGAVVERVGVRSESVTFALASGRGLVACDDAPGPRESDERWCGGAFGSLAGGRLRDPRLSVVCSTAEGEPMAFVWVEPARETGFVAVEQPGFTEVYEIAAGLPVRVAMIGEVDLERARAELAISEHDASGALLRRYRLHAAVAG